MNKQFLKDSLRLLTEVREEIHTEVSSDKLQKFDEIIRLLEEAVSKNKALSPELVIILIGTAIECIPEILEIIQMLSGK